jgi:hypothetical protein
VFDPQKRQFSYFCVCSIVSAPSVHVTYLFFLQYCNVRWNMRCWCVAKLVKEQRHIVAFVQSRPPTVLALMFVYNFQADLRFIKLVPGPMIIK